MGNPVIHAPGLFAQILAAIWIGHTVFFALAVISAVLFVSMIHLSLRQQELRLWLSRTSYGRAALAAIDGEK